MTEGGAFRGADDELIAESGSATQLTPSASTAAAAAFGIGMLFGPVLFYFVVSGMLHFSARLLHEGWPLVVAAAPFMLGVACGLTGLRWLLMYTLSFFGYMRSLRHSNRKPDRWPFASVLVPAYNEEDTIEAAVESLLELDYPHYEVIVVDDGSDDRTGELARRYAGEHEKSTVRVYRKSNGGKWSALNYGLLHSRGEYVLCLDADSRLQPDSLRGMVRRALDPNVSAVAGQVRVGNRNSLLTWLQGLEYMIGIGLFRCAQGLSDTVLVVPGPIALYRRSDLEEAIIVQEREGTGADKGQTPGPFAPDTFAEDFDLSLTMLALRGRNAYAPAAVSLTKAPESVMGLINQRYRWYRGKLQSIRKYISMSAGNPGMRYLRLILWLILADGYAFLVQPLVLVSSLVMLFVLVCAGTDLLPVIIPLIGFELLMVNAGVLFVIMHRDEFRVLLVTFIYPFYQAFILSGALGIAIFDEVRGSAMRW